MFRRHLILSVFLVLSFIGNTLLAAVPEKITGTVLDSNGEPIIGAYVVEKDNRANGSITDIEGNFSLTFAGQSRNIEISCIGYETIVMTVTSTPITIELHEDNVLIEETVIVAFGKQKKEAFTGSSTTIKSDAIQQRQIANPLSAINGQVAGIQMIESNSLDGDPTIRIRGIGSINAGKSPLIVLDGVPYSGYWSDINPSDVESITVLKDAASNALYGARGANGVIMITTKSAGRGKAIITFDSKIGVNQDALIDYETISDPAEYYTTHLQALFNYYQNAKGEVSTTAFDHAYSAMLGNSDVGGLGYMVFTAPAGQKVFALQGGVPTINPNATLGSYVTDKNGVVHFITPDNWREEGLRNGARKEYNLNINGGDDQFQTYASLGYISNQGLSYGSDYTRITSRIKIDYQARKWLKIGATSSYSRNKGNYSSGAFGVAHSIAPIYPLYIRDKDGNIMSDEHGKMYDWGDDFGANRAQNAGGLVRPTYIQDNPVNSDIIDVNVNDSHAFGVQGYADISFLKHFKFTVNGSVSDTENRQTYAPNPFYGYYALTGAYTQTYHYRTFALNTQQLLNYSQSFGNHEVSALLGHEYTRNDATTLGASKSKFYSFDRNVELDGALVKTSIEGNTSMYNVEGFFFRGQYEYDNRYYASASYRRDGSSRSATDYRWGNFWSVGGAWIISKENWFDLPWINLLKFKTSYGSQGNDEIGNFRYTDYYKYDLVNGNPVISFSTKGKKDITWETNGNFNTGFEFELLKNRISGGIEYYHRKTTDMLLWVSAPISIGYSGYYDNVGDMMNQGVELELNVTPVRRKNMTWNVNFNISHNQNLILSLNEDNKGTVYDGHAGYTSSYKFIGEDLPLNTWRLKKYAGVDDATGKSLWYKKKSDGTLTTTDSFDDATYMLAGSSDPSVYGGFGTSMSTHGFDVNISFLYSIGGKSLDQGYASLMASPYSGYSGSRYHKDIKNAWTPQNTDTDIPRFQYGDLSVSGISDRWLTDASSLTFKSISAGYTLPDKLSRRIGLSKVRFYAGCDNVWYWSRRKGFDPRTSLSGYAQYGDYAPTRSISGGINVQF
ncbi:MAG: SusC/RagA family TonB-linked outer membrane protein [Bacteroidaceae bacterium]|nr:SusC/RagA family TonB-linked outer membrane protein [Bacteroidaceae bacterium]